MLTVVSCTGSYCLIQFSDESYDSFKLYVADQRFKAMIHFECFIRCPKFSMNMQNSPRLQATNVASMINIKGKM